MITEEKSRPGTPGEFIRQMRLGWQTLCRVRRVKRSKKKFLFLVEMKKFRSRRSVGATVLFWEHFGHDIPSFRGRPRVMSSNRPGRCSKYLLGAPCTSDLMYLIILPLSPPISNFKGKGRAGAYRTLHRTPTYLWKCVFDPLRQDNITCMFGFIPPCSQVLVTVDTRADRLLTTITLLSFEGMPVLFTESGIKTCTIRLERSPWPACSFDRYQQAASRLCGECSRTALPFAALHNYNSTSLSGQEPDFAIDGGYFGPALH
jgi:hypothetical protein